ncbi:DUF3791 domain-containing protein [Clostridium gasigenes]|uniref:DUF3791 domain-containing protein n=1 Tax=Clostridium gasigenes TaxID=94869 RepID=UPI001C0AA647|nr:DUF3791 domain-containing protein [Clostridium gasigenes]MBU3136172.1 DUF3791 domain-containing protein [Clostridium gasigenes]
MKNLYSGDVIIEFISFCIENFKMKHNMKGKEVANLFNQSGVIDFLTDGYDILHTQGKGYIIDEIEQFLKKRGYKI